MEPLFVGFEALAESPNEARCTKMEGICMYNTPSRSSLGLLSFSRIRNKVSVHNATPYEIALVAVPCLRALSTGGWQCFGLLMKPSKP